MMSQNISIYDRNIALLFHPMFTKLYQILLDISAIEPRCSLCADEQPYSFYRLVTSLDAFQKITPSKHLFYSPPLWKVQLTFCLNWQQLDNEGKCTLEIIYDFSDKPLHFLYVLGGQENTTYSIFESPQSHLPSSSSRLR